MIKVELTYTPKYTGAKTVKRQEKFEKSLDATLFVARMQRMYPDAQFLTPVNHG
tara:strand:- start:12 stop:173 length:162 start_codon:yes stop_codon:yes gene_type:complete